MKLSAKWLTDKGLNRVMTLLSDAGYEVYLVGGFVRNAILNEPTSDFDISTSAHPNNVLTLAKEANIHALPTGIEHGTVTLIIDKTPYEITSFRKDVETDGRRAVVSFSDNIKDDALRRDLTMNALYAKQDGTIVDPLNGLSDLLARNVRFIENPQQRIKEDYLRILRFFRFYAWYGDPDHGPDQTALAACAELADGINKLSRERIGAEMQKILSAPNPAPAIASMAQAGVLNHILAGADIRALAPLVEFERIHSIDPDWTTRLSSLTQSDVTDSLRLSKTSERKIFNIRKIISDGLSPSVAAYRFGYDTSLAACLILAASLQIHPDENFKLQAAKGARAKFPIKAADLPSELQGRALGNQLRLLEGSWIASDFELSKSNLLSLIK